MTTRFLAAAVAALSLAGSAGLSLAQTSGQQQNAPQNSQATQGRTSQGEASQNQAPQNRGASQRQTSQARSTGRSTGSSRQTAQARLDPWHAKGHELDNIADLLNACMLHPADVRQSCIDAVLQNPDANR